MRSGGDGTLILYLQAVELLGEHQHFLIELKRTGQRFTSEDVTRYNNLSRGAELDKVTEFTSTSGKEDDARLHLAGLQQLSSTCAVPDTHHHHGSAGLRLMFLQTPGEGHTPLNIIYSLSINTSNIRTLYTDNKNIP